MRLASGRRIPLAPPGGWLTVGLVLLLCLTLAWSLDDARLVLGRDAYTDFLVWSAVGGVLAGFVGPMVGWHRWTTYVLGAIFAALVTPLIVGAIVLDGEPASLQRLFEATAEATRTAYQDLVIGNRLTTTQFGHHLVVLGLIVWASSMFASFAVFGHRRPLNAVLLIGALLVANMSLTVRDQLVYLVIYSLAALFLLIRTHTFEEQSEWIRRRIGDPAAISGLYLRGGTIFITVAVLGALLLTNVAASDPLAVVWRDAGGQVVEWSRSLSRFLPQSGTGVALGPSFGASATITGSWFTNDGVALTVEVPADRIAYKPYWRAVTYDTLVLDGYVRGSDAAPVDREASQPLLDATGEATTLEGREEVTFSVTPVGGSTIYAPQTPISVDVPSQLQLIGDTGFFAALDRDGGSGRYTVTSYVPILGDEETSALTKNKLRVAGTDYPADILARFAQPPPEGLLGPGALEVLADIRQAGAANPYDQAAEMVAYLRTNFDYDTNITDNGTDCGQLSSVECFAQYRRGYCQYYAAMMTAFLRVEGIPARVAEGFLPGDRSVGTGIETVRNDRAHAWVEVYFPRFGWVEFDPTSVGALAPIPDGAAQPSLAPAASASVPAATRPPESDPRDLNEPGGPGGATTGGAGSGGPLIAVALLLAVIIGAFAIMAWRRGPRGPVSAEGAYGSVTRLATRFGFGPRPNQTVYEYAGALAEILPSARPELETVARAKVEVAYGGRRLGDDRLTTLREAQRRLRIALLRLAFRRDRRGRRR
ncbi:MAG: transglutaminase domain-containing protein [Candidatus Limnocylindrales bacterium]